MATGPALRGRLARVSRSIRTVLRCLGGTKESPENAQRCLLLLCELLDLLCRLQDQLTWAEEKWVLEPTRLLGLNEILRSFESTMDSLEVYFQPGGVTSRSFRKRLLENTFVPRLEQFKVMMILSMQPESKEKSHLETKLRSKLREFAEMDSGRAQESMCATTPNCDDYHHITSRYTTKSFMRLADLCNRRQKGTCEWIFDNEFYTNWLFGCFRSLYFVGPAGTGKTFLASSVIDNLQRTFTSSDVAIVFIFGQDETEDSGSPLGYLDTMLAQLVYRKRSPSHATAALYKSVSFQQGKASAKAYQDAIRAEVNRFSRVFFIIDGIDMQSDKERILNRLQKLPEHAQFLITMREARYASKDEHISVLAVREDLETYAIGRINQDEGLSDLLKQYPPELKTALIRQVVQKSHGLFLLARLHMDMLSRCADGNILQKALFHLPESLNDAYGESMTRIVSKNPFISRCLYWTLYACRPLTMSELNFAANFEPLNKSKDSPKDAFSEQAMLDEAAGLLTIDHMTGTVQLVHRTAKEYLSGPAARVFFPTAKKSIADTCLTIITNDEIVDECYINQGTTPRTRRGGLLDYAATYWGNHAREVGDDEQTTSVLIRAFLNKLCWRRPPIEIITNSPGSIPKQLGFGSYFTDWSGLHFLAYFGITGKAIRLIEQGADINDNDNDLGVTPLHCAVHQAHEEMIELLLDRKVNVNLGCKQGNTALHVAAEQGHRKIIRTLLHCRMNSRATNEQGFTALQVAIGTVYDEAVVPLLVKSRFDMDVQNSISGNTALHLAVELKRPRIIQFLLEKGASTSILNKEGMTPLQLACKIDNCEAISMLLERGAKPEIRSSQGDTALHVSAAESNWIAFDLLITGSADINAWGNTGESLLHSQARIGRSVAIATHLLDRGANIEACDAHGYTPIQSAAAAGNKLMFIFLMEEGANIASHTAKGESILHIVPSMNQDCVDILEILLDLNFNPNSVTAAGLTPIHRLIISQAGFSDVTSDKTLPYISMLLSHGADIDAPLLSKKGETALHLAVITKMPQEAMVSYLIRNGASVDVKTSEGKTPLHLAAERGRHNLFKILLDAGADPHVKAFSGTPSNDSEFEEGETALDLAQRNPVGQLWFNDLGKLEAPSPDIGLGSIATTIDEVEITSEIDEMGGSTLVGDEGFGFGEEGSTWGSRASSNSMEVTSMRSLRSVHSVHSVR
ncbi:hypothetical protein N7540_011776 [Penicillium herquei]|nr:hypothetical protein N7540_011776 [Penicillium herquei]